MIVTCDACSEATYLEVKSADLKAWHDCELIQRAMPYLDDGERELLISGTCEKCFNELFKDDAE